MAGIGIINQHPTLFAILLIGCFVTWKFVLQPIMNEGKSLDPTKEDIEGFKFDATEELQM